MCRAVGEPRPDVRRKSLRSKTTPAMLASTAPVAVRFDELGCVSTMIDGHGPYHFVLDTGAGITVITPELAARLGLSGGGSGRATGSGGTVAVRTLALADVRVGKAEVHDVATAVIPLPLDLTYQGDYGRIDGVIGYSFLSHFAVTIDIKANRVTLSPPALYRPPPGASSVPADLRDDTPVVEAQVDGITGFFKLDTGDSGGMTIASPFAAAHRSRLRYSEAQPSLLEGVGGIEHAIDVRVSSFTLGGSKFANVVATLSLATSGMFGSGTKQAGTVGKDILRCFIFTVDYVRRHVYFTARSDLVSNEPYRAPGMMPSRQADGTFRILAVIPDSPAFVAGLRKGDVLVAVNGDPLSHLDSAQIGEALAARAVTFTVRSGGKTRTATLILRDLLPLESSSGSL
jgi:hypothetical protein